MLLPSTCSHLDFQSLALESLIAMEGLEMAAHGSLLVLLALVVAAVALSTALVVIVVVSAFVALAVSAVVAVEASAVVVAVAVSSVVVAVAVSAVAVSPVVTVAMSAVDAFAVFAHALICIKPK